MAPILSPLPTLGGLISEHLSRRRPTTIGGEDLHPTRTLPQAISKILPARQATTTTVVTDDGGGGLSGGAIAGIVVGTVVGTLLLLWLIRSCLNLGYPGIWGSTFEPGHEKPSAAPHDYPSSGPAHHHHHRRRHSHSRSRHGPRSRSRHSYSRSRSPRRVSVTPVVVAAPQPAYYPRKGEAADGRRGSDGRRYRRY